MSIFTTAQQQKQKPLMKAAAVKLTLYKFLKNAYIDPIFLLQELMCNVHKL